MPISLYHSKQTESSLGILASWKIASRPGYKLLGYTWVVDLVLKSSLAPFLLFPGHINIKFMRRRKSLPPPQGTCPRWLREQSAVRSVSLPRPPPLHHWQVDRLGQEGSLDPAARQGWGETTGFSVVHPGASQQGCFPQTFVMGFATSSEVPSCYGEEASGASSQRGSLGEVGTYEMEKTSCGGPPEGPER